MRVNRIFALAVPTLMAILNLSSVAVVWFGGRLVSEEAMPIGNLTAFLTYIPQILISVMMAILVPRDGERGTGRGSAGRGTISQRPAAAGALSAGCACAGSLCSS